MTDSVYYKNGCNPPLLIVKEAGPGAVWVVPAELPWASSRLVRRDALTRELSPLNRRLTRKL